MSGFRGYVASRRVRGELTPQHVQNLVIRDYATRNELPYRLSATEYSMPGCFMMLEGALAETALDGLILFSLFMLPGEADRRRAIYARVLDREASLHFALESMRFESELDIDRLEDLFRVEALARRHVPPEELEPARRCPLCGGWPGATRDLQCGGITSDVKPWPRLSTLCSCARCGAVYKDSGAAWQADVAAIYADYSAYHLADGQERKVPDGSRASGGSADRDALSPRSSLLASFAASHHALGEHGRLLDVGCGNGAFLRAFAAARPGWSLTGLDHAEGGAEAVAALGAAFICGDVTDEATITGGEFDLISLVHVLEHVPEPIAWLSHVAGLLAPTGAILVDCPDVRRNPFDLAVADHVLHFDRHALLQLAARAGLEVVAIDEALIGKELVALLVPATASTTTPETTPATTMNPIDLATLDRLAAWLDEHTTEPIGVLGTGIAATWAAGVLGARVAFFVDEDEARRGRTYLGVPVIGPAEVEPGRHVFVAQPPALAASIASRLAAVAPDVSWIPCPVLLG